MDVTKKTPYLEGTVHQGLIQVYDHADLSLVLGLHGRQEAEFMLLTGQDRTGRDRHTRQHRCVCCADRRASVLQRYRADVHVSVT